MSTKDRPLLASDQVRLYLTLVPYLLEHGQVPLEEAAADFDVTPQQMRGMVEKLTVIGLPGDEGYWQQPHELFDINWDLLDERGVIEITNDVALRRVQRFTAREAAALLAGLQMVAAVPRAADSELVTGLIAKLSRGATDRPIDVVVAPDAVDEVRSVVSTALSDGVAVSFTYQAPDAEPTTRTVDPVQVMIVDGQWYLQGWCHLREAMRTFHLDRVSDPRLTQIPSTHAGEAIPEPFTGATADGEVVVRVPAGLVSLLDGFSPEIEQDGDHAIARLRLSNPRAIRRFAARLGGRLEVVGPAVAREATREWAEAGLARYPQPEHSSGA